MELERGLPHDAKRDLLALVKKMVALERAANGAAAETQKEKKDVFRRLALRRVAPAESTTARH